MLRIWAFIALASLSTIAMAQTDSPWLNWVANNSPHGFDMTPDGDLWINVAAPGEKDDYAIMAEDLKAARDEHLRRPEFWVRGYHKRNASVRYRETKSRFRIDCDKETVTTLTIAYYGADKTYLGSDGPTVSQLIVPGTYGAEYYRLFCLLG